MGLILQNFVKLTRNMDLPEAHKRSDMPTIAPLRIMPSVWPVPSSNWVDLTTWTFPGRNMGMISCRIGIKEDIVDAEIQG
jgi:hypothetical protein